MRLHFKKTVDVDEIFSDLHHQQVGAISLRQRPNVEILVDLYDEATQQQIDQVIERATSKGLVLTEKEPGTFVVQG